MSFRIGLTRDFRTPAGDVAFGDIGLSLLDVPGVTWEFLSENTPELRPDQVAGFDGLLVLGPKVTAGTLAGNDRLAVVARFGVGYDNIDVPACTAAGVALTITPDGVRRPVAVSAITFLLALSHKLLVKDKLTRDGRWADKLNHMGMGVTGRTLGVIGVFDIGREIFHLAKPFDLRHVGFDPFLNTIGRIMAGVAAGSLLMKYHLPVPLAVVGGLLVGAVGGLAVTRLNPAARQGRGRRHRDDGDGVDDGTGADGLRPKPARTRVLPETLIFVEGDRGSVELCPGCVLKVTTTDGMLSRRVSPPQYPWANPAYAVVHSSARRRCGWRRTCRGSSATGCCTPCGGRRFTWWRPGWRVRRTWTWWRRSRSACGCRRSARSPTSYLLRDLSNATGVMPAVREHLAAGHTGMRSGRGFHDGTARDPAAVVARRDRQIVNQLKFLRGG
jgi:hypothetical protein